jgi:hypothetical protein
VKILSKENGECERKKKILKDKVKEMRVMVRELEMDREEIKERRKDDL